MDKWKLLKKLMKEAQVIIEVVDARDIEGTRLPIAERMAGTNRLLILANKKDLLSEKVKVPRKGMLVSAKTADKDERKELINAILAKNSTRPMRALFIGYPNVGKSSLINMLAHRKAAKVSALAGTTKNVQWVRINEELQVTDYRGMFPDKETRSELVRKGALDVHGDEERYAYKLADDILKNQKLRTWLEGKYDFSLKDAKTSDDVLAAIAKRRNWYIKGGELNISEAAKSLLRIMREAPEI
ncbi:50S ribosome-binding GTPase [Candidatus Micrarchaeota archaeon]|nr:50S ribosome-binding GTPase [Candidatus Micrarchaeota archaeon]